MRCAAPLGADDSIGLHPGGVISDLRYDVAAVGFYAAPYFLEDFLIASDVMSVSKRRQRMTTVFVGVAATTSKYRLCTVPLS
jgi:hypothetical protein